MKKFVAIYYSTPESKATFDALSVEEKETVMQSWETWAQRCREQLVDLGNPLIPVEALDKISAMPDPNKAIGGYSIVKAQNLEDAKLLFWDHPHQNLGIQLLECVPV